MRKYILAALFAGSVATPAFAQDDAAPLSGFRVEGIVGYETADAEDENADGIVYGLGLGYDVQTGGAIVGIEAEGALSGIDKCIVDAGDSLCVNAGRDLYVGGRVGAAIGASSIAYVKAGYTNANVEVVFDPAVGNTVTADDDLDGVRVGGGVQFGLGGSLYAKAEYRYSNYEQGFDKHQGVVGLGLRF